jgi:hypothetical protein
MEQVSSVTFELCMNSNADKASPPWHPSSFILQEITTYGEMLMSGQTAFLAIFILSEKAEVAAWAQQDPQY